MALDVSKHLDDWARRATNGTVRLGLDVSKHLDDWAHRATNRTVRLAVTGLNQSGKTVFTTAVIHQLLHAAMQSEKLPFFNVMTEKRFRGAQIVPQPDLEVPTFRYDRFSDRLTASRPVWPPATDGMSEIRLAIRYKPAGFVRKRLAPTITLYLDIIDYPGEWLLDLPMLDLSFDDWSQQILRSCSEEPRCALSAEWRNFLNDSVTTNHSQQEAPDEEILRRASRLYTTFLERCKEKEGGLSLLQPGRFLMPGDLKDAPILTFSPLDKHHDALRGVMSRRYERYKDHVIRPFYKKHFSRFDRQIVLIDLLKALNNGSGSFTDTQKALQSILENFRYGTSGLLTRLFKPKIDKALFAVTKVDHVAANQHHNLERLLRDMMTSSYNKTLFKGVVHVKTMAISSMVCTKTVVREHEGRRLSFVQGIPKGEKNNILLFPGEIPEAIPHSEDWSVNRFKFVEFEPQPQPSAVLSHIRLDQALEFLLGDKLR